jgi:two-component system, LytTR family, response regulator
MRELSCIAIDDEPLALDIVADYVNTTPFLTLKAIFTNPLEAIVFLQSNPVDLIFLDIQMPELSGLKLPTYLKIPAYIVYTTAYENYAARSYELAATDYLVKPFSYERFLTAVSRVWKSGESIRSGEVVARPDHVYIRANKKIIKVNLEELICVEGLKDYAVFITRTEKIVSRESLRNIELLLLQNGGSFIRIHKSYIVAVKEIKAIYGNILQLKTRELPIGKTYRAGLLQLIQNNTLGS